MLLQNIFSIKAHALGYASRGFAVFPCARNKAPLTQHGFKDATTDPQQISAWWHANPDANIGIRIRDTNCLVLDADPRKGGDKTLAEYEDTHEPLPVTPTAQTGSGGRHYWFAKP